MILEVRTMKAREIVDLFRKLGIEPEAPHKALEFGGQVATEEEEEGQKTTFIRLEGNSCVEEDSDDAGLEPVAG